MVSQIIVLQGGEDVRKRTNEQLMKSVCLRSTTKKILVVPWTSESKQKELDYRAIYKSYFSDSGFQEVLFLEHDDSDPELTRKFSMVDVIYLPGGDPEILYKQLKIRSLDNRLRNFRGILIGNSAGAIVLSKGAQIEKKFYPGFGLVNFYVSVHFNMADNYVSELNPRISIPEDMWICIS
ncbi:MAG: Type 1 glutamine amidotransferase-like domain-containing protein [Thermoplasmata archaeon]